MTPRSLFVIVIKILGICMLKEAFVNSKELSFHITRFFSNSYEGYADMSLYALAVVADLIIVYVFVFRPELVIDRLKLDKGFYEEQFSLTMDRTMVMNIVIIIAGLYLLIDNVPELFKYLVKYFNSDSYNKPGYTGPVDELHNITFCFVKIVLAYIMLTNNAYLAKYITNRKAKAGE